MSRRVHLVGSVPLAGAREVFTVVGRELGPHLTRIPDGETGERSDWITWLEPIFAGHEAFEPSGETFQLHGALQRRDHRYRLKPGVAPESVRFDNILYGDIAIRSHSVFAALKQQGLVPSHCKFQVDLVPAHSAIWLYVQEDLQRAIDAPFNDAVLREIDKIAGNIPHDQLSRFSSTSRRRCSRVSSGRSRPPTDGTRRRCRRRSRPSCCGSPITCRRDIDLLFHFCYGDAGHKHVVEPTDMGDMVEFANRLRRQVRRRIQLLHMPVPRDRSDDAYFAPLDRLELSRAGERDLPGPRPLHRRSRRSWTDDAVADREEAHRARFAIACTECGFGRRDPATVPALLRIHREVASTTV